MFIAMNRFKIVKGEEEAFEQVWRERDRHLDQVPGYKEFQLLKGPEEEDHTLYASHTVWTSREAFEAWTKSEAFRKAHAGAGDRRGLYIGHPMFEGFEVVLDG
ncbi:antibiotic biosynthesis monooxygenase family protein [Minwuia thermotolerans]|uniref:Antibiotic biosynthesis monooxygenase n=1 Tax=Minwuia thermotolerans TaxID=2056226 RepID=A0A2M9FVK9_9PROT|nr:antibiotic biosynthesis monooxygenase [Minwuia thermotolerans]PJK27510.1 antibiotic biosynthesis monooxygenase [Minwuia thermotolerans]